MTHVMPHAHQAEVSGCHIRRIKPTHTKRLRDQVIAGEHGLRLGRQARCVSPHVRCREEEFGPCDEGL